VELVDTQDLKSCGHCDRAGSTPAPGTLKPLQKWRGFFGLEILVEYSCGVFFFKLIASKHLGIKTKSYVYA
jgi:hypothetical protein